jgi:hypothetical protein
MKNVDWISSRIQELCVMLFKPTDSINGMRLMRTARSGTRGLIPWYALLMIMSLLIVGVLLLLLLTRAPVRDKVVAVLILLLFIVIDLVLK